MPTQSVNHLPQTTAALEDGQRAGIHSGAQVYVARGGEVMGDFAIGQARPGVALAPDSLTLWLSACKPIAAIACAMLSERGLLALNDPVADLIPEFAENGKEAVTLEHLLTHTSGLRLLDSGWPRLTWSEIIDRICAARLEADWTPGQRARYDASNAWFIIGEMIRRADGRPYERFVRDEIFVPLGMNDCWIGMPPDAMRAYGDRLAVLYRTDVQPNIPLAPYDTEPAITHCRPAANGRGPARELGRFYQMLLNGGELGGRRLAQPATIARFTAPRRVGMFDETFKHKIDWGLGFLISSKKYGYKALPYSFGPHASDQAFGHNGFQSSMALADPLHQLVIVTIPTGAPGEPAHDRRLRAVLGAVYEDLGLVGTNVGHASPWQV